VPIIGLRKQEDTEDEHEPVDSVT